MERETPNEERLAAGERIDRTTAEVCLSTPKRWTRTAS
jgi:hypothetical protein